MTFKRSCNRWRIICLNFVRAILLGFAELAFALVVWGYQMDVLREGPHYGFSDAIVKKPFQWGYEDEEETTDKDMPDRKKDKTHASACNCAACSCPI